MVYGANPINPTEELAVYIPYNYISGGRGSYKFK